MDDRKSRIGRSFGAQAARYDLAAEVQWQVADRLAARIGRTPLPPAARILEIGCGTGFLSAHLAHDYPDAALLLTDIAPSMLERCRARVGDSHRFRVMDGEHPDPDEGPFDLIAASLATQWFVDLGEGLARLSRLLAPGGRLMAATLGRDTFREWRDAHRRLDLVCGTPVYPAAEDFPFPPGLAHRLEEERIGQAYASGQDFVKSLKALGAGEPAPGHRPLSPGAFRRLLGSLSGSFIATYHLIYVEILG